MEKRFLIYFQVEEIFVYPIEINRNSVLDLWLKEGIQSHIFTTSNLLVNQIRQTVINLFKDKNGTEKYKLNPYELIGMSRPENFSKVKMPHGTTIPPISISTLKHFNPAWSHKSLLIVDEADEIFNS